MTVTVTDLGNGQLDIEGCTVTDQGDGTILISATVTDQGDGTVLITDSGPSAALPIRVTGSTTAAVTVSGGTGVSAGTATNPAYGVGAYGVGPYSPTYAAGAAVVSSAYGLGAYGADMFSPTYVGVTSSMYGSALYGAGPYGGLVFPIIVTGTTT